MTREEIISGLKFTVEMFLFNPGTGEKYTEPRNDMDKTTIDACKGAIELLKQEPCSDTISRRAVLEYIEASEAELGHSTENELACQHIKEFPPVVPQPNMWIPVSNKPKEEGSYMATLDYGDYGLAVGQRFYYGDYGWTDGHVIAWMALPEPYKPQESEVEA